jgi:hypothetical protein
MAISRLWLNSITGVQGLYHLTSVSLEIQYKGIVDGDKLSLQKE